MVSPAVSTADGFRPRPMSRAAVSWYAPARPPGSPATGARGAALLGPVGRPGCGVASAAMVIANRWVTTRQIGFLLGFMGTRVLGQYDFALLSAEAEDGRLLFVEENIRATARSLDVPIGPFRTWIALHETTHAFEFEGPPWLRPYLAERLERQP